MNHKNLLNLHDNLAIGIDFGTTYCLVSVIIKKKFYFFTDNNQKYLIPSVINIQKNSIKIGWEAKKTQIIDPVNTISSIKRMIGYSFNEIKKKYPEISNIIFCNEQNQIFFQNQNQKITVIEIIEKILNFLVKLVKNKFKKKIKGAVITVPAYFNNIQRNEIRLAAKNINLKILRLLNEPTSAAIAYGLEKKKKGKICIYDFGGGTFDVSILKISNGIFEVLSTHGDNHLGGDDFDILIAKYLYQILEFPKKINKALFKKLLFIAEKIKIKLSKKEQINFKCFGKIISINKKKINILMTPLIEKSIKITNTALLKANLKITDIENIILVGGSTYIPLVREKVKKFFKKNLLFSINPMHVVAKGAALHAYHLFKKNQKFLLLDIIPISIGIELLGGIMEKMIKSNTKIPITTSKIFTTYKDNQTGFKINIFQGEEKYVKNCQLLTEFKITGLPKQPAGSIKILITFQIDADGLLTVIVEENKLKIYKSIKIDAIYKKKNKTIIKI